MEARKPGGDAPTAHSPNRTSILGSAFASMRSFFTPERTAKKVIPLEGEPATTPDADASLSALGKELASLNLNDSAPESDGSYQTIDSHFDDSFKSANSTALEEMLCYSANETAILDGTLLGDASINTTCLTSELAEMSPNQPIPNITITLDDGDDNLERENDVKPLVEPGPQDNVNQSLVFSPSEVESFTGLNANQSVPPTLAPSFVDTILSTNVSLNDGNECSNLGHQGIVDKNAETAIAEKLVDVGPEISLSSGGNVPSVDSLLSISVDINCCGASLNSGISDKLLDISGISFESNHPISNSGKQVSVDSLLNNTLNTDSAGSSVISSRVSLSPILPHVINSERKENAETLSIEEVEAHDFESHSDIEELSEDAAVDPEVMEKTWDGGAPSFADLSTDSEIIDEMLLDTDDRELLQEASDDEGDISVDLPAVLDDEQFSDTEDEILRDSVTELNEENNDVSNNHDLGEKENLESNIVIFQQLDQTCNEMSNNFDLSSNKVNVTETNPKSTDSQAKSAELFIGCNDSLPDNAKNDPGLGICKDKRSDCDAPEISPSPEEVNSEECCVLPIGNPIVLGEGSSMADNGGNVVTNCTTTDAALSETGEHLKKLSATIEIMSEHVDHSQVSEAVDNKNEISELKVLELLEPQNIPADPYDTLISMAHKQISDVSISSNCNNDLHSRTCLVDPEERDIVKQDNREVTKKSPTDMSLLSEAFRKATLNDTEEEIGESEEINFVGQKYALKDYLLEDLKESPISGTRSVASYASPCSSASGEMVFASTPVESPLNVVNTSQQVDDKITSTVERVPKNFSPMLKADGSEISPVTEITSPAKNIQIPGEEIMPLTPLMDVAFMQSGSTFSRLNENTIVLTPASKITVGKCSSLTQGVNSPIVHNDGSSGPQGNIIHESSFEGETAVHLAKSFREGVLQEGVVLDIVEKAPITLNGPCATEDNLVQQIKKESPDVETVDRNAVGTANHQTMDSNETASQEGRYLQEGKGVAVYASQPSATNETDYLRDKASQKSNTLLAENKSTAEGDIIGPVFISDEVLCTQHVTEDRDPLGSIDFTATLDCIEKAVESTCPEITKDSSEDNSTKLSAAKEVAVGLDIHERTPGCLNDIITENTSVSHHDNEILSVVLNDTVVIDKKDKFTDGLNENKYPENQGVNILTVGWSNVCSDSQAAIMNQTIVLDSKESVIVNAITAEKDTALGQGHKILQIDSTSKASENVIPMNETVVLCSNVIATVAQGEMNKTIILDARAPISLNEEVIQDYSTEKADRSEGLVLEYAMNDTVVIDSDKKTIIPSNWPIVIHDDKSQDGESAVMLNTTALIEAQENTAGYRRFEAILKPANQLNETVVLEQINPSCAPKEEDSANRNLTLNENILQHNAATVIGEKGDVTPELDTNAVFPLNETVIITPPLEVNMNVTQMLEDGNVVAIAGNVNSICPDLKFNYTEVIERREEANPVVDELFTPSVQHPQLPAADTQSGKMKHDGLETAKKSVAFILPEVHNTPSPMRCAPPSGVDDLLKGALQCAQAVAALAADTSSTQQYLDRTFKEPSILHDDSFEANLTLLAALQENRKVDTWNLTTGLPPNKNNNMFSKVQRSNNGVLKEINDNVPGSPLKNMGGWFSGSPKPVECNATPQKINESFSSMFTSDDFSLFNTNLQASSSDLPRESLYVKFDPLYAPKQIDSTIFVQAAQCFGEPPEGLENLTDVAPTQKKMSEAALKEEINRLNQLFVERERTTVEIETANKQKELQEIKACDALRGKISESDKRLKDLSKRQKITELNSKKLEVVAHEYKKTIEETTAALQSNRANLNRNIADLLEDKTTALKHFASAEAAFIDVFAKYNKFRSMAIGHREKQAAAEKEITELTREISKYDERIRAAELSTSDELAQVERAAVAENEQHITEVTRLKMQLRKVEMQLGHIEDSLTKKVVENKKLAQICDDLIDGRA